MSYVNRVDSLAYNYGVANCLILSQVCVASSRSTEKATFQLLQACNHCHYTMASFFFVEIILHPCSKWLQPAVLICLVLKVNQYFLEATKMWSVWCFVRQKWKLNKWSSVLQNSQMGLSGTRSKMILCAVCVTKGKRPGWMFVCLSCGVCSECVCVLPCVLVWSVSKSIIWPPACLRGKARSVFWETGPLWRTVEWHEFYKVSINTSVWVLIFF